MDKFTKVWIILVLLTLLSFSLGWFKLLSSSALALLILTIFIKGQLISEYFMELKETQGIYRFIPTIWLLLMLTLISLSYYIPQS